MKSLIMIAYYFPPEANAGSYRPLRFLRCLSQNGWRATVISIATDTFERYDPKLVASVPAQTRIIRVPNRDPWRMLQNWRAKRLHQRQSGSPLTTSGPVTNAPARPTIRSFLRSVVRNVEACLYHPDPDSGWIGPAVKAGVKEAAETGADIIWATAGPVSSFVVARHTSEQTGIPYVLDFRDAWTITYNDFEERRPSWAKRRAEKSMYDLLANAQSIVFRYDTEAECYWRAYKGALNATKIYIIPNGFEGSVESSCALQGDRCEILYTGTVSDYRYDTLLQALAFLQRSSPNLRTQLHVRFVGEGSQAVAKDAMRLGVDVITAEEPKSVDEINRLTKHAHALLVLGRHSTMRGYELFAGAKLFGYLKSGAPIVGVLPPDETRKILLRLGAKTVVDVDSVTEIVKVLRAVMKAWSEGTLASLAPDRAACEQYSAERQNREFINALEGKPAEVPFVPGSAEVPPSLRVEIDTRSQRFATASLPVLGAG